MKYIRSFLSNKKAISAVIGVMLMVAITAAMAAVAYAYLTGMIGGQKEETPVMEFLPSESDNTVTVSGADPSINWQDVNITSTNGTHTDYIQKTGIVSAGNLIDLDTDQTLTGDVTIKIRHIPSNTQVYIYNFKDVS